MNETHISSPSSCFDSVYTFDLHSGKQPQQHVPSTGTGTDKRAATNHAAPPHKGPVPIILAGTDISYTPLKHRNDKIAKH